MNYEEFLVALSDTTPEQAYGILCANPDHEYKRGYELIISKKASYSYLYARDVIRGRFEPGEKVISKESTWSYIYAETVIRGRFESGEEVIKNSFWRDDYAKSVMKNPNFWEET